MRTHLKPREWLEIVPLDPTANMPIALTCCDVKDAVAGPILRICDIASITLVGPKDAWGCLSATAIGLRAARR